MWDDKIKGNTPLNSDLSLTEIKLWLVNKGLLRLSDITSWESNGNWAAWAFPDPLERGHPNLLIQQNSLMNKLSGLAPIHLSCKDVWGWGSSGNYTTAHGFKVMQHSTTSSHNADFWKSVWNSPSIPKVIFFTWTLMHQKVLTGENLSK